MVIICESKNKYFSNDKVNVVEVKLKNFMGSKKVSENGTITINRRKRSFEVDLKRNLDEKERLEILKKLFYDFCISEESLKLQKSKEKMEEYKFIDVCNKEDVKHPNSVICNLMSYDKSSYNVEKEDEKVISYIISIYNSILKMIKKGIGQYKMPSATQHNMTQQEEDICYLIIYRYLKKNKLQLEFVR